MYINSKSNKKNYLYQDILIKISIPSLKKVQRNIVTNQCQK